MNRRGEERRGEENNNSEQHKNTVFRFIIEYSSLRDFGPYVIIIGLFLLYEDF
jgi:hypothetical protein